MRKKNRFLALAKEYSGKELTEKLVALAKSAGGGDNITVVVLGRSSRVRR